MRAILGAVLTVVALGLAPGLAEAQVADGEENPGPATCTGSGDPDRLAVGFRYFPPFVILEEGLPPAGLSIELWERVALDLVRRGVILGFDYVRCDSFEEQGRALSEGRLDVVISPYTITPERLSRHDFSQTYFVSGLTLADGNAGAIAFGHALEVLFQSLFHEGTIRAVMFFLGFNMVLALFVRWLLRDAAERGEGGGLQGFGSSFAEAVERTLGLKGLSDRTASVAGRVLEIFMAITGALFSAALLGVLTTSFVSAIDRGAVIPSEDLPRMRVAAVEGSTAAQFLSEVYREAGLQMQCVARPISRGEAGCVLVGALSEGLDLMLADGADVVVGDWAALSYFERSRRYSGRIRVESVIYRNDPFGWGLRADRPDLRRAVDAALIGQIRRPDWRSLVERYLGQGSISPD